MARMRRSGGGRRGGGRSIRRRRNQPGPQSLQFIQRGTIPVGASVGVSLISLQTPNASCKPVRYQIEIAVQHIGFYQVQIFDGALQNALIRVHQGTASSGRRTIRGTWPSSIGMLSADSSERAQNLIEIDHPCLKSDLVGDSPIVYFVRVWLRRAGPTTPDTCPTLHGTPRLLAIAGSSTQDEDMSSYSALCDESGGIPSPHTPN